MNIHELKAKHPQLYSEVLALGVNSERKRFLAAELIVGAVESRNWAPVNFARVPVNAAGRGGPAFVVPTYC